MAGLIITNHVDLFDGSYRENGRFNPEALTLEDAIEVCVSQNQQYTTIKVVENDSKRTSIISLDYNYTTLVGASAYLAAKLKQMKVTFWCRLGDKNSMAYNLYRISDDSG